MQKTFNSLDAPVAGNFRRILTVLLWLALAVGWMVSVFSVIQEMCLVSACRDTAGFTVFGINMGWFGIAYFSLVLTVLGMRKKVQRLDQALAVLVFSGIGAELRLLWIQKYVIGGWCPLCVTICCALFIAAILLVVEKTGRGTPEELKVKRLGLWLAIMATMSVTGLLVAYWGVRDSISG